MDGYLSLYKSDKTFFIKKAKDNLIRLDNLKSGNEGSLPMDKKTMAFYFGFLYDKLLHQKTKVLTEENRDNIITNTELIDPYDFNLPQFGLSTGMSYGISFNKLNLSTHLRYNLQGLTADSMLKKDGRFEFEFRRANVLNRLSLALAIQMQ